MTAPFASRAALHAATARSRLFAKGRLPTGVMNRTETRFIEEWIKPRTHNGQVLWWKFEAIKLRLAGNTFLTVDFAVMAADGVLQMIDVKGSMAVYQDDARVKTKVAASLYPLRFFIAVPRARKDGGGWLVTEIAA